jgi:DNA-binding response OmpR family regulator
MAKDFRYQPGTGPLIFVIDDEPMLLDLAEDMLKAEGFQVRTFQDPGKALEEYAASNPPPALILTDYAMGSLNGLDVIRKCRRLRPSQKIILVSGTVDEGIYADTSVKPDTFLSKPYNTGEFMAAVRALAED